MKQTSMDDHLPHIDTNEYHLTCGYCRREVKLLVLLAERFSEETQVTLIPSENPVSTNAKILDKIRKLLVAGGPTPETFKELCDLIGVPNEDEPEDPSN